MPINFLDIAIY